MQSYVIVKPGVAMSFFGLEVEALLQHREVVLDTVEHLNDLISDLEDCRF